MEDECWSSLKVTGSVVDPRGWIVVLSKAVKGPSLYG
ncbi:hypothetical protein A2U01_0081013, partial [Trifolium medium]|nr:hypothetical protein [Trifolium medium]